VVLFLPHPLRSPRKAFRRVPRQCVQYFSHLRFVVDRGHKVPNPVLGGVTTFLFASVATSGLRVLGYVNYTRRNRFILAAALCFGFGDLLVPDIFTHLFDGVRNPSSGLSGLMDAIEIVLTTSCEYRPSRSLKRLTLITDRDNSPHCGFGGGGAEPDFTPRG
jgi:hypothetical protein